MNTSTSSLNTNIRRDISRDEWDALETPPQKARARFSDELADHHGLWPVWPHIVKKAPVGAVPWNAHAEKSRAAGKPWRAVVENWDREDDFYIVNP